jgi:hypothetical protein
MADGVKMEIGIGNTLECASSGQASLIAHALDVTQVSFYRERSMVEMLTEAIKTCPELVHDLNRHRYMMGFYKSIADDLSGPRARIMDSAAWHNSTCPDCARRRENS